MKNSEHPFLQTILNLTLERHIVNHLSLGCWCLYYLILRWVISKSLNQIRSWMVIIFPCVAWNCTTNECSEYLYSAFKYPDQYYDLWVYGFVWMQVYFQVGMIIGDTEQHNKICAFCGGNGLHRRHMSWDCNVTSDDADNPNIKCTRKKRRRLAGLLGGWWQHKSRMKISCYGYWLTSWFNYLWLIPHWQHGLLQSCNLTLQR